MNIVSHCSLLPSKVYVVMKASFYNSRFEEANTSKAFINEDDAYVYAVRNSLAVLGDRFGEDLYPLFNIDADSEKPYKVLAEKVLNGMLPIDTIQYEELHIIFTDEFKSSSIKEKLAMLNYHYIHKLEDYTLYEVTQVKLK